MTAQTETRIVLGYNQFLCAELLAAGGRFSLSLFEDFNRLIEAVVLYDKVIVLGQYSLPSGILATPLQKAGIIELMPDAELSSMVSKAAMQKRFYATLVDVFGPAADRSDDITPEKLLILRTPPNSVDQYLCNNLFNETISCNVGGNFQKRRFTSWISENIFNTRYRGGHFFYFARAILYATIAEEMGMDYSPDILRLPIAAVSFSQGTRALPKALYDALADKVCSEVDALALLGMPVTVFVPPLTAKLLSLVNTPDNYVEELLKLRDKFSDFRNAYAEFLAILKDTSVTLRSKIDAKKKMISRITGIIESGESRHALNVKTIWDKVISASLDDAGLSTKLSLSGMVSLLLDQIATEAAKGHARALFDLWTDALNLEHYGHLVEKAFKTEIEPEEVKRYKQYSQATRVMLRSV